MTDPDDRLPPRVIDVARVTVSEPVRGLRRGRGPGRGKAPTLDTYVKADPAVLLAARRALRPGQRLLVQPDGSIRLVNRS